MDDSGSEDPSGSGEMAERLAIGLITWAFPAGHVDLVLAATGRTQQRKRLLPARVVVYFVLALCLFPSLKYERVARLLSQGLIWGLGRPTDCPVPTAAALSRARARLGPEPLRALFAARGAALPILPAFRGYRVLAVDSTGFAVPDSEENLRHLGSVGSRDVGVELPRVMVTVLGEHLSRMPIAAVIGGAAGGGTPSLLPFLGHAGDGDLVLADVETIGARSWCAARERGAHLLWRVSMTAELPCHAVYPDGSYRSVLDDAGSCAEGDGALAVPVRVVESEVIGVPVRLITSLLDPAEAPAKELIALHGSRWRFSQTLAELTRGGDGAEPVLRARTVAGVEQEIWGLLMLHQAISGLLRPATAGLAVPTNVEMPMRGRAS
ncbi:hypothetical protein GCM10009839_32030 [Catenulispora yoronensis]|uniref:Transposase IS4 N-terminal domain-containing protein n=1 Tax=Catenulispora yoronensis TaxID=450799 RepID=A0ABP5FQX3_9ACTN